MNKTANQVCRNREPLAGVREEVERLEFCLEGLFAFATDYSDIITSGSIFPDRDISIEFNEYLYLRVERAIDVSVSLNENSLLLSGTPHPTDIMYNGQSKQLTIRSYTPR